MTQPYLEIWTFMSGDGAGEVSFRGLSSAVADGVLGATLCLRKQWLQW